MRRTGMTVDFENFVVARGPSLVRFAHALTGDRHLAEDLVQEVLVKAHRRWARIDSPESYLRSALCRELVSWRRRRSNGERPGDIPDRPDTELVDGGEGGDAVWQALAVLPPRQREVMVLRYWEDLPDRDIAALLSCSEGTVRSSAARAFAALRRLPPFTDSRPEEAVR